MGYGISFAFPLDWEEMIAVFSGGRPEGTSRSLKIVASIKRREEVALKTGAKH